MIVYSRREATVDAGRALARLRESVARWGGGAPSHAEVSELLIEYGRLESGALDATLPARDEWTPLARTLRDGAVSLGRLFRATWRGESIDPAAIDAVRNVLDAIGSHLPSGPVPHTVPEGYAYYALYPETYLAAAERFADEVGTAGATVVGIRSIGTSLSAVVAAGVEARGARVRSFTVRPRGHPWDRRVALGPSLEAELRAARDGWFLVVDEGPGLSGTSFRGAAEALEALGVPDERIVFFPSWDADGAGFVSESARARWPRHRRVVVPFEDVWMRGGRLGAGVADGGLRDVAAGEWRRLFWADERCWPAVQPQHERRKYLAKSREGSGALLLKFAGLGASGRAARSRAERLAALGFAPPVDGLADGFLVHRWIEGRPLAPSDLSVEWIDRMAEYVASLAREFPSGEAADIDGLMEMIRANVGGVLGSDWAERIDGLDRHRSIVSETEIIAGDGRMMAHEWVAAADGRLLKTDGVDHHDDHFFPGRQDPAWDLAGASVELAMDDAATGTLVDRYRSRTGDRSLDARLPFYRFAYLAYRAAYARMGADGLGAIADGDRLRTLSDGYAARLKREIERIG